MVHRYVSAVVALVAFCSSVALAANPMPSPAPTLPPKPHGTEIAFVSSIQKDLDARFGTIAQAQAAGYYRYTNEDDTGAISYANDQWTSSDPQHPSQLWYSAKGELLGADFSRPYVAGQRPDLWGVDPSRWIHFGAHVHYVVDAAGKETYGATRVSSFTAAGGNVRNPQPQTVVALGKATDAAQVKHVFLFPNIWDLIVWVKPNPDGAFADKNPLVTPSADAKPMD